jgi:predicted dehydrogenase
VPVAVQALRHGLRVLLEKPLGRNEEEAEEISAAAGDNDQLVLGLNYRFMPGVAALVRDFGAGRFGKVISVALKLGHGGRPGDEKSWKLDPIRCGGGALLDPGIHVLDLSRHLLGHDISVRSVTTWSGFWKTGIEEYVSVAAECQGAVINLDVSVVRWRSEFNIQVLGTDGYGTVFGRGGNYGRQIYRRGKRWGWQQAQSQSASEEIVVDDACENSFADELEAVLGLSPVSHPPLVTRDEGRSLMSFYEKIKRQI